MHHRYKLFFPPTPDLVHAILIKFINIHVFQHLICSVKINHGMIKWVGSVTTWWSERSSHRHFNLEYKWWDVLKQSILRWLLTKATFFSDAPTQVWQNNNYSSCSVHSEELIPLQAHSLHSFQSTIMLELEFTTLYIALPFNRSAFSISTFKSALNSKHLTTCLQLANS